MNRVYYQVYYQSKMTDRCIVQDQSSLARVNWVVKRDLTEGAPVTQLPLMI